ncbi:hypothetical protein EGW08_017175 [Elysia chlorotica]|uniref:Lysozyme g n=1 Tax=Elysia chlorotica TaxID=188477 RepID=A0A3S0ZBH6_ELYCH|nr:hypothetical protein EGW08_017175 [Elysia chlorotica]
MHTGLITLITFSCSVLAITDVSALELEVEMVITETRRVYPRPDSRQPGRHANTTGGHVTGGRTCHGDIAQLRPTGEAGRGVAGSQADVITDLPELKKRWAFYQTVADLNCVQASLIAALASRESRGGALLYKTNGYGDNGRAYGILQCDLQHSGLDCLACVWYSQCHIQMMVSQLLVPYIQQVQRKFPTWTSSQGLQGGVAAYNEGVANVRSWAGLDRGTTHNDYSNDVIARAQYLYRLGWN